MACERVRTDLKAFLDGELRGVAGWRVARHVRGCAVCQQEIAALKQISATLQTHATAPLPEGFKEKVLANVGQTDSLPHTVRGDARMRSFVSLLKMRKVWAAAGALAVLTALVVMMPTASMRATLTDSRSSLPPALQVARRGTEFSVEAKQQNRDESAPASDASAGAGGGMGGSADAMGVVATKVSDESESSPPSPSTPNAPLPRPANLHIIRTADISLTVKKFQEAHDAIAREARAVGGFVADSNVTAYEDGADGTVSVRVPERFFEKVVERISALGKLTSKKISAEDVSQEYVDLESRIRNLQREEARLLELINRASRLQDVLTIEQQLSRVRNDIEQATGRVRYLSNLTTLSTINVNLHQPGKPRPQPKPEGWSVVGQFKSAVAALVEIGKVVVTVAIYAIVFAPIYLVVLSFVFVVGKQIIELAKMGMGRQ
jgi:hypothetical protein